MGNYYGYVESVERIAGQGDAAWVDLVRREFVPDPKQGVSDEAYVAGKQRVSDEDFVKEEARSFYFAPTAWQRAHEISRRTRPLKEGSWLKLSTAPDGDIAVDSYITLAETEPRPDTVASVSYVDGRTKLGQRLRRVFSLERCPGLEPEGVGALLSQRGRPTMAGLAVYNVGQGSAAAVINQRGIPLMYFDLGGGWGPNATTYPKPRQFCWTNDPLVVLSHWDWDHYFSAMSDEDAWKRTWIVPEQGSTGMRAQQLISRIRKAGGSVLRWCEQPWVERLGPVELERVQPNRKDKNASGIVLRLVLGGGRSKPSLLHAADVPYKSLPSKDHNQHCVLIASHHGGWERESHPPSASSGGGCVIYSFGKNNSYGHPNNNSVQDHGQAGWKSRFDTPDGDIVISPDGTRQLFPFWPHSRIVGFRLPRSHAFLLADGTRQSSRFRPHPCFVGFRIVRSYE